MSFKISSLTDVNQTLQFVNDHFVPYQPLCKGLDATAEDVEAFHKSAIEKWLKFGLSLGIRCEENGELAGILITTISRKGEDVVYDVPGEYNDKTKVLMKVLMWLELQYNFFDDYSTEEALYYALLAVDKKYSGKRLSYQLMEETEKMAKQKGYKYAYSQLSANGSQHIFQKCGYKTAVDIKCSDIVVDGKNPFDLDSMFGLKTVRYAVKKF